LPLLHYCFALFHAKKTFKQKKSLHRNLYELLRQGDDRDNGTSDRNNRDNPFFDKLRFSFKRQVLHVRVWEIVSPIVIFHPFRQL